jgi:hypothetical protein
MAARFLTLDTEEGYQERALSLHKYLYCEDNPVNRKDPTGHETVIEVEVAPTLGIQTDLNAATASAVAKAFAMRRIETAVARWTLSAAVQLAAVGLTVGGYEIYDEEKLNGEFERIQTQTAQRSNPTRSAKAYHNFECDTFAEDAKKFFQNEGKDSQIIRFQAHYRMIKSDQIWANVGALAGMRISESGYHEGCLVDGEVFKGVGS